MPASLDLYLPDAGRFASAGSLLTARAGHTATLLDDGRVLFVGGAVDPIAELYDPASGTSIPLAAHFARTNHTATRLADGRVVIAGGCVMDSPQGLSSIEVFDPRTNALEVVASDLVSRRNHAAVLLPDGRVLLAGGESDLVPLADVTLFDPATRDVTRLERLVFARRSPTGVIAPDDTVVIVGGGVANAETVSIPLPPRRRPVRRW
ncbi:MAG: Kelch repeat-containing protein [Thermoanaerobaculia bacterium]